MANFVYAWELGDNLGHIGPFLPVARVLRARGHTVRCVLPPVATARKYIAADGFAWQPAPAVLEKLPVALESFGDMLLDNGFHSDVELGRRVSEWLPLLRGADVVFADFAATALLAARILNIPVMLMTSSFGVPVVGRNNTPMICQADPAIGQCADRLVLMAINKVLSAHRAPVLTRVPDLYRVAEYRALAVPSLDVYQRPEQDCWGLNIGTSLGENAVGPLRGTRRCYVYLRNGMPWQSLLIALRQTASDTVVFAPDIPEQQLRAYAGRAVQITQRPLDLGAMARQVDLAITYGNSTTTATFLAAGVPVFICPMFREQQLMGEHIVARGIGLLCDQVTTPTSIARQLDALLSADKFSIAASAWAKENAELWLRDDLAVRQADRAEELVPKRGWFARVLDR